MEINTVLSSFRRIANLFICLLVFITVNSYATVNFSIQRGYYSTPIQLTLSTPIQEVNIIYTLDNSKPTPTNGLVYNNEPIPISSTKTIKAISYNQSDTSKVTAHTYIFLEDILEATYMDTSITKNRMYESQMEESFLSLPTISLSSNQIKTGQNFEPDVETSLEMIYGNNEAAFQVNCGIETWGGSKFNLKKHYRLEFKTKYGPDELEYPLFDDFIYPIEPVKRFNRLLLRSGSQDGLNCEYCDESKALFIRNRVMMDLQMNMGYASPNGRFVHVWVNQQYEGVYHLMERPDADFFKDYYFKETNKKEIEVRKNDDFWQQSVYPTVYDQLAEISKNDLSVLSNFQRLTNFLDVEQTAAYLLLNDYGGNFDWDMDRNNLGASTAGHPYKFILWDVDLTLNNEGVFEETYGDQLSFNSLEYFGAIPEEVFENQEFRMKWADAVQCNCFEKGVLTVQQVETVFVKRAQQIEKALIAESARWGNIDFDFNGSIGHLQKNNWDVFDEWEKAKNLTLSHFIANRTDTLIKQYQKAGIFPEIKAVEYINENIFLEDKEKIELFNPNEEGEIYYTTDGSDPREFGGTISEKAILYETSFNINFPAVLKSRIYLNENWSAMCPKKYYQNQAYNNLLINEIHYQPLDSVNPNLDTIAGKYFEFIKGIQYQFKSTTEIQPKQFLVLASDSIRFTERYNFSPLGVYAGHLSNQGETILLKNPINQTIDSINYGLDLPWPVSLNQQGNSLSLKTVDLETSLPGNWQYSKQKGGTPSQINFTKTALNPIINNPAQFVELTVNTNHLAIISHKKSEKAVQIYTLNTQLIYKNHIETNQSIKKIELNHFPSGIYILMVNDKDTTILKKLFHIQK